MRKILATVIFLSWSSFIFGQAFGNMNGGGLTVEDLLDPSRSNVDAFSDKYANIVGSPYLSDDWEYGQLRTKDGTSLGELKLKYDIYQDMLLIKSKGSATQTDKNLIDYFLIEDKKFVYKENYGFVEAVTEGVTLSLFRKYKKKYEEAKPATGYNLTGTSPSFQSSSILFISDSDGMMLEVPKSKKKIESLLAGYSDINFKKEGLNIRKEEDLIKAIVLINN